MVRYGSLVLSALAVLAAAETDAAKVAAAEAKQHPEQDGDQDSPSEADADYWSSFSHAVGGGNAAADASATASIIDAIVRGDAGSWGLAESDPLRDGMIRSADIESEHANNNNNGRELYKPRYANGKKQGNLLPSNQQQNQPPSGVSCQGGALQVPAVDAESCLRPGQGLCADGWTFFIGTYVGGYSYLMLWYDDDSAPVFWLFAGATQLCIGERFPNIAYLYVDFDDDTYTSCYLASNSGNPNKLPRLKIVPDADKAKKDDVVVKFRDGAGDDALLTIAANGLLNPNSWECTEATASPTVSPRPSGSPSESPTKNPTASPTKSPTGVPSPSPTKSPTASPTPAPTKAPTASPSSDPSASASPSTGPTVSLEPSTSVAPSSNPTQECPLPRQTTGSDSCQENCGGRASDCYCDEFCVSEGDCCTDAASICGATEIGCE